MKKDDKDTGQSDLFGQGMDSVDAWAGVLNNSVLNDHTISMPLTSNQVNRDELLQLNNNWKISGMVTYAHDPVPTVEARIAGIETTLIEVVSLLKLIGSVALDRVPEIKAKKEK